MLRKLVELGRASQIPNHAQIAFFLINIGTICQNQGRDEEALEYYSSAFTEISQNHEGEYLDELIGSVRSDIKELKNQKAAVLSGRKGASCLKLLNRLESLNLERFVDLEQSKLIIEKIMQIKEKTLGANHPLLANSFISLGWISQEQENNSRAALDYYHKALRALESETNIARNDLQIAYLLNRIGMIYLNEGCYSEAFKHHYKALELMPQDNPDRALVLNHIGLTYEKRGRKVEAADFYKKAMQTTEKLLGPHNHNLIESLDKYADILYDQGQYEEALAFYTRSLEIGSSVDANRAFSYNRIGSVYRKKKNHREALDFYERALALKKKLGDRPGEANLLDNMAIVYQTQGREKLKNGSIEQARELFAKSVGLFKQALEIKIETLPDEHSDIGNSYLNIGMVLKWSEDFDEAVKFLKEARRISHANKDDFNIRILDAQIAEIEGKLSRIE